jgi:hypothetical protein
MFPKVEFREPDSVFCFDAFSSREPVAISFDDAMEIRIRG